MFVVSDRSRAVSGLSASCSYGSEFEFRAAYLFFYVAGGSVTVGIWDVKYIGVVQGHVFIFRIVRRVVW